MSEPIKMPALGESVTEGTVNAWLKEVGDTVEIDEPILEVSTDKVDTEVPSPVAGILEKIEVQEDETVEVGTILGYIGDGSGAGATSAAADPVAQQNADPNAGSDQAGSAAQQVAQTDASQVAASGDVTGGVELKMPALGESVNEGTVNAWLKNVGDTVEEDEPILEVSTDKVDTEVPAPAAGVITQILVQEDETVEVGTVLAIIGGEVAGGAAPAQSAPAAAPAQAAPAQAAPAAPAPAAAPAQAAPAQAAPAQAAPAAAPAPAAQAAGDSDAYVTPVVRKLAKELGVDLGSVTGTGVGGRVRRQDVEKAAEEAKAAAAAAAAAPAPVAAPAASSSAAPAASGSVKAQIAEKAAAEGSKRGTREKMSGLRKTIAKRMVESLSTSAQLTTFMEVDCTKLVALRNRAKGPFQEREGIKLTFLPFFVQAATETLKAHPIINASVEGNEIVYHGTENIGIAVDTPKGLYVPVIENAGDLNISGISRAITDLAARTREGTIKPEELSGSTFTVTNTGSAGAIADTPIINQPNVAILGTGVIYKAPGVVKDQDGNETISIRSKCVLSISYDHRIIDGAAASRYLRDVKSRIEEADFDAELGL